MGEGGGGRVSNYYKCNYSFIKVDKNIVPLEKVDFDRI